MILYDLSKTCTDGSLANIMNIVRRFLNIIQIVAPILLILILSISFVKIVMNPDEKKNLKKLFNSCMALIILFFIPLVTNVFMKMADDSFDFSKCWNYSEIVEFSTGTTYISLNEDNKKSIITNSSDYDGYTNKEENDSSNDINGTTTTDTGTGLGKAISIKIEYNKKDSGGRCGKGKNDRCVEIATVKYPKGTITYYMGYQNNSGLLGGSCRSHAYMCALNATNNSSYSTLDLQKYLYSTGNNGVLRKRDAFNKANNHFNAKAKSYFNDISASEAIKLAKKAVDNGQPVIIFVAGNKCSDLANSHHAILLLGYDNNDNVIFLDSVGRYRKAKKRTMSELGRCMSGDNIAKNWMRMTIFSF